jgi:DNA modification methylase
MAMKGKMNVRTKIVINNNILEQVNSFNYLGCIITVYNNTDLEIKRNRFNQMCSTIRTMNNKTRKETQINFYTAMAVSTLA